MREGWTYKRFEDCLVKALKAKQVQTSEYGSGTKYPIISQEEKLVSGYCDDESLLYHIDRPVVIFGDHTRALKYVDFDFIVGADGVKILIPKDFLKAKFLLYYLQWYNIPNLGYSRHYKLLKEINVPTPHLDIQQSIVAELDKINELIGLKKSQLSDLDSLGQSIFYDMFGDPVKGIKFERSTIGNIITNIKYGTGSPPQFSDSGFCFIRATNIKNGHIDSKDMMYIDANEASRIEKCRLSSNDLIIVRSGVNAGDTSNIPTEYVGHYAGYDIIITVNKELVNTTYINGVLNNKDYVRMIIKPLTRRAAQPHLNSQQVQGMNIPLPPLPLQQSFAVRIAAIEQQKQRISASIKDLETLLASRMQYWFD